MDNEQRKALLERIKNPAFLLAVAGLLYQLLSRYGIITDMGTFQIIVDVVSYIFLGVGIYSTFLADGTKKLADQHEEKKKVDDQ